jgi:transposase InsO family protein
MLGRGRGRFETAAGYEYLHVCVDDYSRVAYVELLPDERAHTAIAFLRRALAFFAARGVACERILTDNGSAYLAHAYALACLARGLRHTRTRPRRPRTNGKAERRFLQTMLAELAYARSTQPATNGPARCRSGSTITTTGDHTAASATDRLARG